MTFSSFIAYSGVEGGGGLGNQFQGLLEAILNCLPLCLKDAGCNVSVMEETVKTTPFQCVILLLQVSVWR